MAPRGLPSLGVETPLDDAIAILKRRQVLYSSAPILPLAVKPQEVECEATTCSWASQSTAASVTRSPPSSKTPSFKPAPFKKLPPPVKLPVPRPRPAPASPKPVQAMQMSKSTSALPRLPSANQAKGIEPMKPKVAMPTVRPSSRGQVVSRAAAAAFWGIILEDEGGDWLDDEDSASTYGESKKPRARDFPLSSLHAATSVPLSDLKEACSIFELFASRDSEDLTEARLEMRSFEKLLCHVCNVQSVDELSEQFVMSAFSAADRDRSGNLDIWEFVVWFSAFSFSESICVNPGARSTRNVARKHGLSLLNIERYKKSFDRYDLNNNGVIEFNEFKHIITDLLKVPPGLDLPHERLMSMWRSADKDGSGSIDFDEFVAFYMKYFGDTFETEFDPVTDYYRSMRRVQ